MTVPAGAFSRPKFGGVDDAFGKFCMAVGFQMINLLPDIVPGCPWKHCGSKGAKTVARAYEIESARCISGSQLSH